MNGVLQDLKTKQDLAGYLHACTFIPALPTFLRAIRRGHIQSWPGLTPALITKHLFKSLATSKGHLRSEQKNIQSTKIAKYLPLGTSLDASPSQDANNKHFHVVFATIVTTAEQRKSYSDQTGKFPVQSSRGYNYTMILYDNDSNAILSCPLKTRQASEIIKAWTKLFERLKYNGYAPELHILDKECSNDLKKAFTKNDVEFQRVPPHSHRRNAAERAIQTWKNHFCAGISTYDPKFPLTEWDLLMVQADIMLNLLRSSRGQPKLSAYACLNGNFDFNQSPLAPPWRPQEHASWSTPRRTNDTTWLPTASTAGTSGHLWNTTDVTSVIFQVPSASATLSPSTSSHTASPFPRQQRMNTSDKWHQIS